MDKLKSTGVGYTSLGDLKNLPLKNMTENQKPGNSLLPFKPMFSTLPPFGLNQLATLQNFSSTGTEPLSNNYTMALLAMNQSLLLNNQSFQSQLGAPIYPMMPSTVFPNNFGSVGGIDSLSKTSQENVSINAPLHKSAPCKNILRENNAFNIQEKKPRKSQQVKRKTHKQKSSCGTHSSKFKGVHWNKACKAWRAQISVHGKTEHLGNFDNEKEAAQEYDRRARELGRNGLNFKDQSDATEYRTKRRRDRKRTKPSFTENQSDPLNVPKKPCLNHNSKVLI